MRKHYLIEELLQEKLVIENTMEDRAIRDILL